jgi:hypothetical protein
MLVNRGDVMPESYTLIEMELYQMPTMPPVPGKRAAWLHAAIDGEDGEVTVACSYPVISDRDVPRPDLPFSADSADFRRRMYGAPRCPECVVAIEATA